MKKYNKKDFKHPPREYKNDGPWTNRILVGTPTTGLVRMEWVNARYGQIIPCNWSHVETLQWMSPFAPSQYLLPDAENLIAKAVVEGDYEWLLSLEEDNVLPRDAFIRINEYMKKGDVPIVSGLYFTKSYPPDPIVYRGRGNGSFRDFKIGDKVWVDGIPFGCFPKGRNVKTKNGWKNIEDIKTGEMVETHTGKMQRVYDVLEREHEGENIVIHTNKFLEPIEITPEHPILAVKGKYLSNGGLRKPMSAFRKYLGYKPEWVPAGEITDEHVLLYKINEKEEDISLITISDSINGLTKENNKVSFPNKNKYQTNWVWDVLKVDEDFLRLLGYWVAEGESKNGQVRFSFHRKETEYISDVKKMMSNVFGLDNFTEELPKDDNDNSYRITFCSKVLSEWLSLNFGDSARTKKIPQWLVNLKKEKQEYFLSGYIRGDGCIHFSKKGSLRISSNSVSYELSLQIREIFLRLGVFPSFKKEFNCGKENKDIFRWGLIVSGEDAKKLLSKIEPQITYKTTQDKKQGGIGWIEDGFAWFPVRNAEKVPYKGKVYNLSVEEDESYTVSGFTVHNCTLIHGSIIKALWDVSPEYMVNGIKTRRVFKTPDAKSSLDGFGDITTIGTTDLAFCSQLMKDDIFIKAGWPEYQKKENPFLVDTNIFVGHIDRQGRNYPLGGIPVEYLK